MTNCNIVTSIFENAVTQPDILAIAEPKSPGDPIPIDGIIPYRNMNFRELATEVDIVSRGLLKHGFKKGDRVVLMVPPSINFFTLCFAFMHIGVVPVLIDPGIGITNLKKCIKEANPVGFIGISKAHIARVVFGWGKKSIRKKVSIGPGLFYGGLPFNKIMKSGRSIAENSDGFLESFQAAENDLAAILFTSGSTGISKGVSYTYGNFMHQVKGISSTFGMESGEIDLPTFPPFALFNPVVGVSTIIPDMDATRPASVDPKKIIATIRQFNITNMFGSPALIDRVGRYAEMKKYELPSLKRVITAGAPVPEKALRRFSKLLNDGIHIYTPYGATEVMPVTCVGSDYLLMENIRMRSIKGGGICIGKPVKNIELKIIKITDDVIASWSNDLELDFGEVGEIVVKGPNVTKAYYNREVETRLAKIMTKNGFYHRMGDLGYRDETGNVWYCGRKAHRVRTEDRELYSVQCETIFNQHPMVYRTALVSVNREAVLCVEVDKEVINPNLEEIKIDLTECALQNNLNVKAFLFHPSFPVDKRHNAKIFREKLAKWAASRL
ncbi:fatty acid CoA ligase family protein [Tamlana flava]|uniref:fatty acid CoA ligase family protein n=1 Tax=Tamlana flava TaxID=3158572 RepID=UPI00351BDE96